MTVLPLPPQPPVNPQAAAELVYARSARTPAPAYLLCIFLGTLGLHRFYMHRKGSALAMLLITVVSLGALIPVTLVWSIVDLFLISGILRTENFRLRSEAYGLYNLQPPAPTELA